MLDAAQLARGDVAARLGRLGPGAHEEQPAGEPLEAELVVGAQQVHQPLAALEATEEEDVRDPVAPARERRRVAELAQVDAVGDDLVLAGEVAADEMACRGADRDAAVELLGEALEHPLAELVRGAEARVGVERGHVDARRVAQELERQERHERLVEVEDVEALALEHLARRAGRSGGRP